MQPNEVHTTKLQYLREYQVRVDRLSTVLFQLGSNGTHGSFAVFMFRPLERIPTDDLDNTVNFQYSV